MAMAANTTIVAMDTGEDSYEDHAFVSDTNHFGSGSTTDCVTEAFQCPITKDIMIKPVILVADGTTYEESALRDWLSENNISPLTGMELITKEYRPNYALQHAINDYLENKKKQALKCKNNNSNKNSSLNDVNGNLGVGLIESILSSKVSSIANSPMRSPRSVVSSDMEIEEEFVSYHSDEEKKDRILTKNRTNTGENDNNNNSKKTNTTPGAMDSDMINGEIEDGRDFRDLRDSRAAMKSAQFDRLKIFLNNIDCGEYIDIFIKEGFETINDLYNITFPDLLAINIPRGHGRRLLKAIHQHKQDMQMASVISMASMASAMDHKDLKYGDPTMSIVEDGSIVDVSFYDVNGINMKNNELLKERTLNKSDSHPSLNGNNSNHSNGSASGNNNDLANSPVEMKQSTMAAHNASIIIYPGKKLPKSTSAAPLNVNVLLLGDAFVGKTSLRKRLESNQFLPTHATQGVELTCLSGTYQGDDLQITVWDPAGQERYAPITKTFFRRAHGAAIIFSADDEGSWKHVTYWLNELETNAPDDIEVMLLCNKVDLLFRENSKDNDNKESELEDALIKHAIEVAAQKRIPFYMTSAKSGECVLQAFQELVSQIMLNEGIVQKIYDAREGNSMKGFGKTTNREDSIDSIDSTNSNENNRRFGLLNRLREQRRKYASNANANGKNKSGRDIIDLTQHSNDTNKNMSMPSCTCAR